MWTPSEYWANPKPLGAYYGPTVLSIIVAINLTPVFLSRKSFLNRVCYIVSFAGNWIMAIILTGYVNAISISDVPTKRGSNLTSGFYGRGWYALVAATGTVT